MLRRMQRSVLLCATLLGVSLSALSGCAYGEVRQVLRAQFAAEIECPQVRVEKRQLWYVREGDPQWKLRGCGAVRTYTCPADVGLVSYDDESVCTYIEGDADAPDIGKPEPADDMPPPAANDFEESEPETFGTEEPSESFEDDGDFGDEDVQDEGIEDEEIEDGDGEDDDLDDTDAIFGGDL